MHRDYDILEYQDDDAGRLIKYEDPHLHAPLSEHGDHDPIIGEHRPSEEDFYTFEWVPNRKKAKEIEKTEQEMAKK